MDMVYIDLIDGQVHYRTYVEARKRAYSELHGAFADAYGQIQIFPNQRSNKPKEIVFYDDKVRGTVVHRVESDGIAVYTVQKNGELGRRL